MLLFLRRLFARSIGYKHYGSALSKHHGAGLEVRDARPFVAGDSVSRINRKLSAKHNSFYVHIFALEQEQYIDVLLDINANWFADADLYERICDTLDYLVQEATRVRAVLRFIYYTDMLHEVVYGVQQMRALDIHQLLQEYQSMRLSYYTSHLGLLCAHILSTKKRRSIVVFSDFLSDNIGDDLSVLCTVHDTYLVRLTIPFLGLAYGTYQPIDHQLTFWDI